MSTPPAASRPVDLGIVVALQEEFRELLAISGAYTAHTDELLTSYRFERGPYRIVAAFVGDMGETQAARVTERLIALWAPATVVVVGIAAGVSDDLRVGDVHVPPQAVQYLQDAKASPRQDDPAEHGFAPGAPAYRADHALVDAVRNLEFGHPAIDGRWRAECGADLAASLPDAPVRERLFGADLVRREAVLLADGHVATGPVVGAAASFSGWIRSHDRNVKALEMESAAVLLAAQSRATPARAFVIRGISDYGDDRKKELDALGRGALRRVAMRNAVRLLWALLDAEALPRNRREKAPFRVPFLRNPSFVGREDDLATLHDLLQRGSAVGVRPAALTGMGGIGKTQLAVEYVYRYAEAYPGGVYWVNAAEPWQAELDRLASALGLGAGDASGSERQRRLALALASYLGERPDALAVFDNVEDPLTLRSAERGFIPEQLGCRLLFTTRRRDLRSDFASVEVRVLSPQAAVDLLLSTDARRHLLAAGTGADRAEAAAICRMLGHLPLAVALAAAFLERNPEVALGDYRGRLVREGVLATVDDSEVDALDLPTRHDAAVGATLRLQWRTLEGAARKSQDARLVMMAATLLGEAVQMPRARLALLTGLLDRAEAGYPARLGSALRALHDLSLLEELTAQEIRLHALVREFAERQMDARQAFAAACGERLGEALADMGRLHEEVAGRGIDAVLGDLRVGSKLAGASGRAEIDALVRPLDRESHALRGWDAAKEPGFLLQQLRNRCFEMGIEDVRALAEAKLDEQTWIWLRERIRTSHESEALVRTLEGHTNDVLGMAVTPDGCFAVSASLDTTLKVWDLATGQAVRTLEGHTFPASGVAMTVDGRFAISASYDATLKVWDLATGHLHRTLEGHAAVVNGVAVTPDGRFALSASWDKTLKVWDLATWQTVHTLHEHTLEVTAVAVTSDGRLAVSAGRDKVLKVWDLERRQAIHTLEGHTDWVTGVAVTPDDRLAVSASYDATLKVWDLATGQILRTLEGHAAGVSGVAVTADGRLVVSASYDTTLKVWDLATGQILRTLEGHAAIVNGVGVTPNSRFAVSVATDKMLKVWDLEMGQAARTLQGHTSWVMGMTVTRDGRLAVSASVDNTLKVWDVATGQVVRTLHGHAFVVSGVALTPDGRFIVSASWDQTLKVWELATGLAVRTLQGHTGRVSSVAVTGDGRLVVSASQDQTLKVWDVATGQAIRTFHGHADGAVGVALTPDDRFVISTGSENMLQVWDLATGQAIRTLEGHTSPVTGVVVTADGRFAVSISDHTLKVWDLATGQAVRTLVGHTDPVLGVGVTLDARFAASVSWDRRLKVWDLGTGQPLATLETHAPSRCCAITPDGKTILVGDAAGALHILDWRNGPV